MNTVQTSKIPEGILRHKVVLRQDPPSPTSFTAATTTQTIFLLGLPGTNSSASPAPFYAKSIVVGIIAKLVTKFLAPGLSNCSCTVKTTSQLDSGITSANFFMPTFRCDQTVSTSSFMYWSPFAMYALDPQDISATFTSVGAQLKDLTAGEIEFTIMYQVQ